MTTLLAFSATALESIDRTTDPVKSWAEQNIWPTELFCGHAQLTLEYAKAKLNVLEPRDLRFGHDLFQPEQQEKILEEVDHFKPELVWIALPCTVWGPWTNINYKDRPQLLRRLRARQRRLIRFAVKVALRQIEQGRHVGFEHPRNSAMWKDPSIADLLQDPLFHEVKRTCAVTTSGQSLMVNCSRSQRLSTSPTRPTHRGWLDPAFAHMNMEPQQDRTPNQRDSTLHSSQERL